MKRSLSDKGRKALSDNMTKQNKLRKIDLTEEMLRKYYIDEGLTIKQIVEKYNYSLSTVTRRLKEFNIKLTKEEKSKRYSLAGGRQEIFTKEELENIYIKQNKSLKEIETEYNISHKQLLRLITLYNLHKSKELERENYKKSIEKLYGVSNSWAAPEVKERIHDIILEKYGVDYACELPQAKEANKPFKISKINKEFSNKLTKLNIEHELEYMNFDVKIGNTLVEIDPSYTHNITIKAKFNNVEKECISKDYHINKTNKANGLGFKCIHIFDWDDQNKIINMFLSKTIIYARQCKLKVITLKEANDFLNLYHLQNGLIKQDICLGLFYKDMLVEVMTFGKPRYNKKYEYELLRLCSHKEYKITGGSEKLFKYFINNYKPKSIISYCDKSKFSGDIYSKLGFILKGISKPSRHWYNIKTKQHITDNLLRQRGFDQLFETNYGKGTSNEELMIMHGFIEVYDCGQLTYVWNNKDTI